MESCGTFFVFFSKPSSVLKQPMKPFNGTFFQSHQCWKSCFWSQGFNIKKIMSLSEIRQHTWVSCRFSLKPIHWLSYVWIFLWLFDVALWKSRCLSRQIIMFLISFYGPFCIAHCEITIGSNFISQVAWYIPTISHPLISPLNLHRLKCQLIRALLQNSHWNHWEMPSVRSEESTSIARWRFHRPGRWHQDIFRVVYDNYR